MSEPTDKEPETTIATLEWSGRDYFELSLPVVPGGEAAVHETPHLRWESSNEFDVTRPFTLKSLGLSNEPDKDK